MTGADLFKIEQKVPYAKDYNECIAQAQKDQRVFVFEVSLSDGENHFEAVAGDCRDEAVFRKMANPRSYKLSKKKSSSANWV